MKKFALLVLLLPMALLSKEMTLLHSTGESYSFEIDEADPFLDVVERIQTHYQNLESKNDFLNFEVSTAGITVRSKKTTWRDYSHSVSKQDKKDIHYIITTLANDSLISIGTSRSSLKKAGERIDYLHPFRFLMAIFTDEELKAGAHAIRDRGGWTWDGFTDGIIGSLKEESARNNVLEFVPDFAHKVKIDSSLILPLLEKGKWQEFVNILIDKIPRSINPNRYDM